MTRQLFTQHLENVSSDILESHPEIIRDYIKGKNGIYALYQDEKLYYVGLATDLRIRLKHHLSDRHSELWNRFSLYLTKGDAHLRELESFILRIAKPKGNVQKTKFIGYNLALDLEQKIREKRDREIAKLFGKGQKPARPRYTKVRKTRKARESILSHYIKKAFSIRRDYKGKRYTAQVKANGKIYFNGKVFNSASMAGAEIMGGHSVNGWTFWKYRNQKGEWVPLDELRKMKAPVKSARGEKKLRGAALAPYVKDGFPIRANYKGKTYTAKVNSEGTILYDGKIYTSPSLAGMAVINRNVNGWLFWKYQNEKGEWVKLDELRK